jgi:predicted 3-demethylubiquinone-9 3-methyltransferase (glyoxalase superfamily)
MPAITPCLWFDDQLEEAMAFYTKVFPNSAVTRLQHYTEVGPGEPGTIVAADFDLAGIRFTGINGGPAHAGFTETISFVIECADQEEIDQYWSALTEGGEEGPCGWLKDRFGLSWQVVPRDLYELSADPNPERANAVMQAMLGMKKLVVADLRTAAESVPGE